VAELDIWRTAKLMVERFGEDAVVETSMRVDQMAADNDLVGRRVWLLVLAAVRELQNTSPQGTIH
jgi:hypothetical protein